VTAVAARTARPRPRRSVPTVERVLVLSVVALVAVSLLMVFSASSVYSQRRYGSTFTVLGRHCLFVAIGAVVAVLAARVTLVTWRDRLTMVLLVGAFGCLLAVQVLPEGLAPEVNGASRWIRLGPVGLQPSDLAKLALVLWLARLLAVRGREMGSRDLLLAIGAVFVPMAGLVLLGDDLGTTLLLGAIVVVMLFLAGWPLGHLGAMVAGLTGAALASLLLFEEFRSERIRAFLDPAANAEKAHQLIQSRRSIASGGLWGMGPGVSRGKWGFLPEAHTDFILSVIGEEVGLIGTAVVLGLLISVVACGFVIGHRCPDRFGKLVAWGVSTWICLQALVNVSVSVGAVPTKGIPLPFISYGGTSMAMSLVAVGVLVAVSRHAPARPSRPGPSRPARARR
jgi:cell division protein FtsW